jgi:hypothetical protein
MLKFYLRREATMYVLLADRTIPGWSGIVGCEEFESLDAAEQQMKKWARFGVDSYCNDPDNICIADETGQIVRVWDWRSSRPATLDANAAGAATLPFE